MGQGRTHANVHYILLAFVFVIAATYQAGLTVEVVRGLNVAVPEFELELGSARVELVKPAAEAAGLRAGDVLLAVNGRPYTGTAVIAQEQAKATPGKALMLTVQEPGKEGERNLELPVTRPRGKLGESSEPILFVAVMPTVCLILGSWVVLVRPRDRLAWLLFGMLLGFSQLFEFRRAIEAWPAGVRELAMVYNTALASAWPIFMLLFGFYFPIPFPVGHRVRRWSKWGLWLIVAPLAVSGVAGVLVRTGQITNYSAVTTIQKGAAAFDLVASPLGYVAVSGFFCFIFMKSSSESVLPADARRRLRLLYWGTTVAMTPALVIVTGATIKGGAFELLPDWLTYPALLLLLLFPLTLAYVIVVQRAMDVGVVVRQGLQYGLAKNGIRALQYIAIGIVIAMGFAVGSHSNLPEKMVVIAVAITLGFSIPRIGERLRGWTDRRFFREAYNAEQVLSDLSDQVRGFVETRPLIETVASRLSDTLHIPSVAVLLGGGGPYRPAFALGYEAPPDVTFLPGAGTVKVLQKQNEPARVYFDDPNSWLYREAGMSDDDRASLAQLQSELLLPLSGRDKLLGFISLGAKRSEEPYSSADVRLLKSVAAQTGLALENAWLMNAITEEVAQRERLNREVEIAREVQERLFPQSLPPIAGIEYAGACRPALGVGGDYYDFLALPDGQLGIAIGDVSGKGIAAALTMASLQASLRGEATRASQDLAALVSNVNRLVYEASSSSRYATFFYGQYNPVSRQLNYVNAGHNPPMLFHCAAGKWSVSRLETGGTVVGLLESFPYQQGVVTIAPGEMLLAFTDGISEAMNLADEEWGEERLKETMQECASLSPADTIRLIMAAADVFVNGAKQHDDMTLVVLRAQL
jgi:sigma-B regulation protein RsbU (phosphoserine phosphatase)